MIKKLDFNEVILTSSVFFNDKEVELTFDEFIRKKAKEIVDSKIKRTSIYTTDVINFLRTQPNGLKRILKKLHLSQEKFKRIITLLRKLDDTFENEWSIRRIVNMINNDNVFAKNVAQIFIDGRNDTRLMKYLPLFYRERLHLQNLEEEYSTVEDLIIELKDQYSGMYSNMKGDAVENLIRKKIESVGVESEAGKISFVDVTVDWAIPNLRDPYVIIMSSYQETTSSGQSTKTRDMLTCYQALVKRNIQYNENRAFVNFVDGGGWLARQNDLRRLWQGCHYFLNLSNLDTLEDIIKRHGPKSF